LRNEKLYRELMIFLQKAILDTSRLGVIELTLFDCANPYPNFTLN